MSNFNNTTQKPPKVGDLFLSKMYGSYIALLQVTTLDSNGTTGKAKVITITEFNVHNGVNIGQKVNWLTPANQPTTVLKANSLYRVSKEQAEEFEDKLDSSASKMGSLFFATYGKNMLGLFRYSQKNEDETVQAFLITTVDLSELDMFSRLEKLEKEVAELKEEITNLKVQTA